MKYYLFFFVWSISASPLLSLGIYKAVDAKSNALGGASVADISGWGSFHNQGCLAFLPEPFIGFSYERRFELKELSSRSLAIVYPTTKGTFSGQFLAFGSPLSAIYKTGLGYSRLLGPNIGMGFHIDILSIKMNPLEPAIHLGTCELGFLARTSENLSIGFHIFNPVSVQYDLATHREKLPVDYRLGLFYSVNVNTSLFAEVTGSASDSPIGRWGLEYKLKNSFFLRGGFQSYPTAIGGGLAYQNNGIVIDFSCRVLGDIGRVYGISLSYLFR